MPGRCFWILAASVGLACAAVAAAPGEAAPKRAGVPPNIGGESFYSEEGGKVIVAVKGMVEVNGSTLSADLVKIDQRTGLIVARGNFVYATPSLRIFGEEATLDPRTDTVVARQVRFGRSPMFFTAEELRMVRGDKTMTGVRMWRNEPSPQGMSLAIGQVNYSEKDDWLSMRNVRPTVAGIPFLYLPAYGQQGYQDMPYELFLGMGNAPLKGFFVRTTVLMRQTPSFWMGMMLDNYAQAGWLAGPTFRYDNSKLRDVGTVWKARLNSAFIHDQGELLVDSFGRLPDRDRSFAYGEVIGRTVGGVEVAGRLFTESDPDFLRDFRPNLVGRLTTPEATLQVTAPVEGGFFSAGLAAKADDHQDVVQRLPELRLDLPSAALGTTGFRRRAFLGLAYLSERPSATLNGPAYLAATGTAGAWSTTRLDAYYGVSYPWVVGDYLTFTPIAGVRATGWSDAFGNGAESKVIGQAGFDLEGLATGSWELDAPKWGILGMRHNLRPLLQVRAMPGADQKFGQVPQSDRLGITSALRDFDLADRLDPAGTTATESVRFGLRNSLETRDARQGTRQLARADFFTDWRDGSPDLGVNGRSNFVTHLSLTPATWVTIDALHVLPNGGGAPVESTQSISFRSGDFWTAQAYWTELNQGFVARQVGLNADVMLSSVYSAFGLINHDATTDQTNLLMVGIRQRLGQSWEMQYSLLKRVTDRGNSSLGFQVRLRLFRF
ncbi:MAG: hypothetical protein EBR70_04075 [Verrucomicrobia bacterium]|nr:hypothetical protein [Verrucomicrobiota bacterium]